MIGETIIKIVNNERKIERLTYMNEGANNPHLISAYRDQLHEERTALRNNKLLITYLRRRLIDEINDRIGQYEREIADSYNAFDIQEMEEVVRTLKAKIAMQQNEIEKIESELLPNQKS
jgi:uncharacterized small protein (DUF1192 family)